MAGSLPIPGPANSSPLFSAVLLAGALFAAAGSTPVWGAAIASGGTGDWSVGGTWVGGVVPGPLDTVTISNNNTVAIDGNFACASLTIAGGGNNSTLQFNAGASLNVTGAVSINAPTVNGINKTIAVNAGTLACGSLSLSATTANTRDCVLSISTGTVDVAGNITFSSSNLRNYITFTGAGLLQLGGDFSLTNGGLNLAAGCTVEYDGAGNQAVRNFTYNNLTFSGGGTKTLSGAIIINTVLRVAPGVTAALGNFANAIGGMDLTGCTVSGTGTNTLNGNVTTNVSGATTLISAPLNLSAARTFTVADGPSAQDLLISGVVSGLGQLVKSELGTLVLTGANTMAGFLLNLGVLESQGATSLSAGNSTIAGGTLRISTVNQTCNQVFNVIGGVNIDVLAGRTLNLGDGANDLTGSALINKIGGGTLVLDQASNHSGGITISAGQVTTTHNTALGTGQVTMNGGTLFTGGAVLTVPNPLYVLSNSIINSNNGDDIEFSSNSISGLPGKTLNYVSTGAGASAHSLIFSGSGFELSSNISLDAFSRVRFDNANGIQTFSGSFLGTGYAPDGGTLVRGYTAGRVGTTRLLGTSTFTGPVSVQAGTLSIGADAPSGAPGALGNAVSAIVLGDNGGADATALVIEGPFSIGRNITVQAGSGGASTLGGANLSGTSTFSGTVTLNKNVTLTAAVDGSTDFTGVIGSGAARTLTKNGAGTVILSAANTVPANGATAITAGTLLVNGSLLTPTTVTAGLLGGSGILSNTVAVAAAGGLTPGSSGPGSVGTLATNAVSLLNTSALNFDLDTPASCDRVAITGDLTLDGVFTVTPFSNFSTGTYTVLTYTGALTNNIATVNPIPGYTLTVDTSLAGQVRLIVGPPVTAHVWDGAGLDNLWTTAANWNNDALPPFPALPPGTAHLYFGCGFASGNPTLNGAKNINSLNINTAQAFMILNDTLTLASGDITRFNVAGAENVQRIASNVALGGNGAWFIEGASHLDVSGAISGGFALTKSGRGELRLSGAANPYTGQTTVAQGTLSLSADGALGSVAGNTVVNPDASLALLGGFAYTTLEALNIRGVGQGGLGAINNVSGNNAFAGNIVLAADSSLGSAVLSEQLTLSGAVSGAFGLTKVGAGSILLTNTANSYSGLTTLDEGTLAVSANNALGLSGNGVLVLNGATLRLDAVNYAAAEPVNISGMGVGNTGALFGSTGNSTFGGPVAMAVASGIGVNPGSRLTLPNVISGGYQLSKLAGGTLEFTGNANTYFGGTAIVSGTLLANNSNLAASATGPGPISVQNGGTLAGTGAVSGPITVLSGGTISPGEATTESLNVTALALATGGTYAVEINSNLPVTGYDQLVVTGPLNLNTDAGAGCSVLVNMGYSPAVADFFMIIDKTSAGPIAGTFAGLPEGAIFLSATDAFSISYVDGDGNDVVIRPVPRVRNVSATTPDGSYGAGAIIDVTIEWSLPVIVTGTPQLTLETGVTDQVASYLSTAGKVTTFRYSVAAADVSADLDYLSSAALALNGGAIQSVGTLRNAILTLAAPGSPGSLGANKNIVIRTPLITARETIDADRDGRIDAIRIVTNLAVNDNFSAPLNISVAGYSVSGYDTGATANDTEFFVRLTELVLPPDSGDTDALPFVRVINAGALGITVDAVGSAASDKAPPVLLAADWINAGSGDGVEPNDVVRLTFSEAVTSAGVLIADNNPTVGDIGLPVSNDSFGTATLADQGPALTLDIVLVGTLRLTPGGTYNPGTLSAGSPTGVLINDGARIRDSAPTPNTAANQSAASAVDLRPGGAGVVGVSWNDHSIASRDWNIGADAAYGAAYVASAAPLNLTIANNGTLRCRFDISCSVSAPSGWTVAAAPALNKFCMKVDPAPPSTFSLDLSTGPKQLAAAVYSGSQCTFDLQFVSPTQIDVGQNIEQSIAITVTASQD